MHDGLQQHLSGAGAAAWIDCTILSGLPQEPSGISGFHFSLWEGRGFDLRLLRGVAKIARGFKGHDLKEASLFPNAGEGRCLRWLHDFPFHRLESAMGASMAHQQSLPYSSSVSSIVLQVPTRVGQEAGTPREGKSRVYIVPQVTEGVKVAVFLGGPCDQQSGKRRGGKGACTGVRACPLGFCGRSKPPCVGSIACT